jgi:non-ribosomal peptide synthetase component F
MPYTLKIFTAEEVTESAREQAALRFRAALDASLGDAELVFPVYQAYLRLLQTHADHPRPWPVSAEEQLLADQWEAAELLATQAAFGADRYMDDAHFELGA